MDATILCRHLKKKNLEIKNIFFVAFCAHSSAQSLNIKSHDWTLRAIVELHVQLVNPLNLKHFYHSLYSINRRFYEVAFSLMTLKMSAFV